MIDVGLLNDLMQVVDCKVELAIAQHQYGDEIEPKLARALKRRYGKALQRLEWHVDRDPRVYCYGCSRVYESQTAYGQHLDAQEDRHCQQALDWLGAQKTNRP